MKGMKQIPLPATKEPSKSSGNDNLQKKKCTKKTSLPETKESTDATNNDDQQTTDHKMTNTKNENP
jgi:hypothetical protein